MYLLYGQKNKHTGMYILPDLTGKFNFAEILGSLGFTNLINCPENSRDNFHEKCGRTLGTFHNMSRQIKVAKQGCQNKRISPDILVCIYFLPPMLFCSKTVFIRI